MEQSVRGLDGLISSLNNVGYDDKDMIEVRTALTNSQAWQQFFKEYNWFCTCAKQIRNLEMLLSAELFISNI